MRRLAIVKFDSKRASEVDAIFRLDWADGNVETAFSQSVQLNPLSFDIVYKVKLEFLRWWALRVAVHKMKHLAVFLNDWESRAWHLYTLNLYSFDFYGLFELEASLCALESAPDIKFMICIDTCREIPAVNVFYGELL